jgi:hypothetical protein
MASRSAVSPGKKMKGFIRGFSLCLAKSGVAERPHVNHLKSVLPLRIFLPPHFTGCAKTADYRHCGLRKTKCLSSAKRL